jgi:hypothetical protein
LPSAACLLVSAIDVGYSLASSGTDEPLPRTRLAVSCPLRPQSAAEGCLGGQRWPRHRRAAPGSSAGCGISSRALMLQDPCHGWVDFAK